MREHAKIDLKRFAEIGYRLECEKESLISSIKGRINPFDYLADLTVFFHLALLQAKTIDKEVTNGIIDFNIEILKSLKKNDNSIYEFMESVDEECFKRLFKD